MDYREIARFLIDNPDIDPYRLLLKGDKKEIDTKIAASTLIVRGKLKHKVPEWYNNPDLVFINPLSGEQASSQATAQYKASLLTRKEIIADLTGGLGVDSWYFSQKAEKVYYFERNDELCRNTEYNFGVLGGGNIVVNSAEINGDLIDKMIPEEVSLVYADPARRERDSSKRVYAIEEYEPNILEIKDHIISKEIRLMVKVSPMLDLKATMKLLPETKEIHVLSVNNETKELLFILDNSDHIAIEEIPIYLVNLSKKGNETLSFDFESEKRSANIFFDLRKWSPGADLYLYEPNSSILKGGAFKYLGERFSLEKISLHSHLYISDRYIYDFPGRVFSIREILPYNHETIRNFRNLYPKTNISVRDFPLSPQELIKKLKIEEGGDIYTFAATFHDDVKRLIVGI